MIEIEAVAAPCERGEVCALLDSNDHLNVLKAVRL